MSAPIGNKNAHKWTLEKTEQLLTKLEDIVDDERILYLAHALCKARTHSKQWRRLREAYHDNEELIYRMDMLEEQFETKVITGALVGRFRANMANFVVKYQREKIYEKTETEPQKKQASKDKEPEVVKPKKETVIPSEFLKSVEYKRWLLVERLLKYNEEHPERPNSMDYEYLLEHPADGNGIGFPGGFVKKFF